jgi:plasmid replication initiation protein
MISRKTPALVEFPIKRDVAADCGSQGPMSQQNIDGSGRNELHPQKLVQLVGFRDPDGRKREGAASVAAVLASAA